MKKLAFKNFLKELFYKTLPIFGKGFANRQYHVKLLITHIIIQKFLRINGHVPWPVHWTSQIREVKNIQRGTRSPGLAINCYIDGRNGIKIGENVWMGPRVSLISKNHDILDYSEYQEDEPIVIGDNCWLGTGCIILPGVKLGNHVIVAAGAVVTKSFECDDIILGGVPAKIIKKIAPYNSSENKYFDEHSNI